MQTDAPPEIGSYFLDPYGRIFVIVRKLTNSLKTIIHAVHLAEYGGRGDPAHLPVKPPALKARMLVEGVSLPILMPINIRDVEMKVDGLTTHVPILLLLEDCLLATREFGIELRRGETTRCLTDPPPEVMPLGSSQNLVRLWARARFLQERSTVGALQEALSAHGRLDTRFAAEVARTIRIVRHFKSLTVPPPNTAMPPLV